MSATPGAQPVTICGRHCAASRDFDRIAVPAGRRYLHDPATGESGRIYRAP